MPIYGTEYLFPDIYDIVRVLDPPIPKINSTLGPERSACPGESIIFTCVTLDSTNQTWTSTGGEPIYIGHTFLIGQPNASNSTKFLSTSAELVSKSELNGRLQLVSQLTIAVPESATGQTHMVTCMNMMDATSISFLVETGMSDGDSVQSCVCLFAC